VLTRISVSAKLSHIYSVKDLMVSKENNQSKARTRKIVFIVLAIFIISIVLLNLLNYFVSYK